MSTCVNLALDYAGKQHREASRPELIAELDALPARLQERVYRLLAAAIWHVGPMWLAWRLEQAEAECLHAKRHNLSFPPGYVEAAAGFRADLAAYQTGRPTLRVVDSTPVVQR